MERGSASRPTSLYSQTSTSSCCSVADSKREMRDLMGSFIADVERIRESLEDSDSAADAPTAPPARSGDTDVDMAQPVPGAYAVEPTTPPEEYEHKGIWCDSCTKKVFGTRHKCLDCYNFDLCNPCYTTTDVQSTHADMPHTFEAIYPPPTKPKAPAQTSATKPPGASQTQCLCSVLPRPSGCSICKPTVAKGKRSGRPVSYKCDSCRQLITGTRHRCMTCPDFDLCEACYTAGTPVFDHSPVHRFMHVEHPIRIITAPAMSANSTSPVCAGGCVHEGARYKCENCDALDLCINCLGDIEKATVEHAAFHAIQEWDQVVRFIPYTKEPRKQTAVVHAADCDACDKTIVGTRHKCTVCHDFDLCDSCFASGAEPLSHKSEHDMLHLDRPQRVRVHVAPFHGDAVPVPTGVPEAPNPNAVHQAWCDSCSERIRGVRHKCLDCEDFDFCDACRGREHFGGAHQFCALVEPGEVIVRDAPHAPTPRPTASLRARGRPEPRVNVLPILPPVPPRLAPVPPPSHHQPRPAHAAHSAACDMCSSRIRGVRYKCTVCPDYDVCESCFRISEDVHPGHSFAKVYNQGDIVVRKSPQAKFRHNARCDVCQNQITGIRYKCVHPSCPDFDICERCEAMPFRVHPDTHALIKLRSHISNYDGLKAVLSFASRGQVPQPPSSTLQVPVVRIPTPRVQIPSPRMPRSPVGTSVEPSTAMDIFHTAAPSPVVPLSTLGCTIVPHTTIVASLPQSPAPEPIRMSPQVLSPLVIPSPPASTIPSPPPVPDSLLSHHSDMYKPSYEVSPVAPAPAVAEEPKPTVTEDEVWEARARQIQEKIAKLKALKAQRAARLREALFRSTPSSSTRAVTVDEERDPEAPQMTLVNAHPISLPGITVHEPTVVSEPVTVTEITATPEPVATPERVETPKPELPSLLSAYPYQAASTERTPIPPAVSISSQEPSPESSVSTLSFDASTLNARFLEDRSIIDGQIVSGGAEFAKCWRMRNTGPTAWPNGTTISFVGGYPMLVGPDMIHWAVTGDLSPDQEIDVEVDMKAPEEPGVYTSFWRLKTPEGEAFGDRVWCEIIVAEMERAGSSGSSEISASSIVVPASAPSMSAASVDTATASPTLHSVPSTVHTPSIADTADIESLGSFDSDDDSDVWEEVQRQTTAAASQAAARSEGDRFEVVYDSD